MLLIFFPVIDFQGKSSLQVDKRPFAQDSPHHPGIASERSSHRVCFPLVDGATIARQINDHLDDLANGSGLAAYDIQGAYVIQ